LGRREEKLREETGRRGRAGTKGEPKRKKKGKKKRTERLVSDGKGGRYQQDAHNKTERGKEEGARSQMLRLSQLATKDKMEKENAMPT